MAVLRRFQDERSQWEAQREELEATRSRLEVEKDQAEQAALVMAKEVERLQAQQALSQQQAPVASPERVDEAIVRSHHEKHLSLVAALDDLRRELEQEQSRSRALEQRALAAEHSLSVSHGDGSKLHRSTASTAYTGELSLEETQRQLYRAEDEALHLRTELNREKERHLELKAATQQRKAAWKEELSKITDELSQKQRLEDEVFELRQSQAQLRSELNAASDREGRSMRELTRVQQELTALDADTKRSSFGSQGAARRRQSLPRNLGGSSDGDDEQMRLTRGLSEQLMRVEQELSVHVKQSSTDKQLLDLFFQHLAIPLASVRRICQSLSCSEEVPLLPDQGTQNLQESLVKVVEVMRFADVVLQAHETYRNETAPQRWGQDTIKGHAMEWFMSNVPNG